ncbi:hypothetical protein BYT27DRAFT_7188858 [Phlegmacium glaucopus]|nr:hypothetical protein BYT27DRAFT_7188858 [Phlegmacium glaucopus]
MFFPKFYCIIFSMIALVSCTPIISVQRGVIVAREPLDPGFFRGIGSDEPDRDNLKNDHDK